MGKREAASEKPVPRMQTSTIITSRSAWRVFKNLLMMRGNPQFFTSTITSNSMLRQALIAKRMQL